MSGLTQQFNGEVAASAAVDNAVAYAIREGRPAQRQRVTGFNAHYSALVSAMKAITIKRGTWTTDGSGPITTSTLSRGSTDTAVASTAFQFYVGGGNYFKAAVTIGTALPAGT